jgi:hypothetical protein
MTGTPSRVVPLLPAIDDGRDDHVRMVVLDANVGGAPRPPSSIPARARADRRRRLAGLDERAIALGLDQAEAVLQEASTVSTVVRSRAPSQVPTDPGRERRSSRMIALTGLRCSS